MAWLECPFLNGKIELSNERLAHILRRHPELAVGQPDTIAATLLDPDLVRIYLDEPLAHAFSKYYSGLLGGKHVVVVVITDSESLRHWVITAYAARRLSGGIVKWQKD